MKPVIVTKGGDAKIDGQCSFTSLWWGGRVPKNYPIIIAVGKIDTLHATIGLAQAELKEMGEVSIPNYVFKIQKKLTYLMGEISCDHQDPESVRKMRASLADNLVSESDADEMERFVAKILELCIKKGVDFNGWVLYGQGSKASAHLHFASKICREAEVEVVKLCEFFKIRKELMNYLNRLSDLLYILGRYYE